MSLENGTANASDLHIVEQSPGMLRVRGKFYRNEVASGEINELIWNKFFEQQPDCPLASMPDLEFTVQVPDD